MHVHIECVIYMKNGQIYGQGKQEVSLSSFLTLN